MAQSALTAWLDQLERRSPESRIELGLDRVQRVFSRLPAQPDQVPVVTVAGTNGKGSVVAFLEAMARACGHRTFAYTSPHLIDFAERFRIDGIQADAAAVVAALDKVEQARGQEVLTYFEHTTLAGFVLAKRSGVDLWILEVGLGGRLDAVNVLDPDVAVISSIGLDHTEWLGPTRLDVGREKAGIARPDRPLVIGERRLPRGLDALLEDSGARVCRRGREFRTRRSRTGFTLSWPGGALKLPMPALPGDWQVDNAATATMAARLLAPRLSIPESAIRQGLLDAEIPGRMQCLASEPDVFLDVAHNPAAARALAGFLSREPARRTVAVFAALRGKDVPGVARALMAAFDDWLVAPLAAERALSVEEIAGQLRHAGVTGRVNTVESIPRAIECARALAGPTGRVVVFGSFRTVAEAWPLFDSH